MSTLALGDGHWLHYSSQVEIYSIMCIIGSVCSLVTGGVLLYNYFACSYSTVLRSAFNDIFVAVVMLQVMQALQLFVFSLITVVHGRRGVQSTHSGAGYSSAFGMSYVMCNINASLHQFLDGASQILLLAFFIVLADSRRLTSLEEVDASDDGRVVRIGDSKGSGGVFVEEDRACSSSSSRRGSVPGRRRSHATSDACHRKASVSSQPSGVSSCICFVMLRKVRDNTLMPVWRFCLSCHPRRRATASSPSSLQGPLVPRDVHNDNVDIVATTRNKRHTLLRVTWKAYLAAFLGASFSLLLCWMVLVYVPGLVVGPTSEEDISAAFMGNINGVGEGQHRSIYNTLFFSQDFAWCWIPNGDGTTTTLSSSKKMILLLLQIVGAYLLPIFIFCSAVYAYFALRVSSPSLMRDHPIVFWRILIFCLYPTIVLLLGAVARFITAGRSHPSAVGVLHEGLAVALSFMYPFTATVNVVLFLYTEELLGRVVTACGRFFCCFRRNATPSLSSDDRFDCGSDVPRGRLTSEEAENSHNNNNSSIMLATTGFCGVVKAIACSTVTGLPPGVAPYVPPPYLSAGGDWERHSK